MMPMESPNRTIPNDWSQRQYLLVISEVTTNIWTCNKPEGIESFQAYAAVTMRYLETNEEHDYFDKKPCYNQSKAFRRLLSLVL